MFLLKFLKSYHFRRECTLYYQNYLYLTEKRMKNWHLYQCRSYSAKSQLPADPLQERAQEYFPKDLDTKNKDTFIEAIYRYRSREKHLRGHVEFIHAALKVMKEYGVHKDLEAYKELLDVMPKEKMILRSMWEEMLFAHSKHQMCVIELLNVMELNAVMPDTEVRDMIICIFGIHSRPMLKFARMFYWMPRFKYLSPWRLPEKLPDDALELAKIAIQRIASADPGSRVTVFQTNTLREVVDDTWIVSAQSPKQMELLRVIPKTDPLKVEGPFGVYIKDERVYYFILRAEPLPLPYEPLSEEYDDVSLIPNWICGEKLQPTPEDRSVHEQNDGVILALCATGTSSPNSLLSWVHFLQEDNPILRTLTILFKQHSPVGGIVSSLEKPQAQIED